MDPLILPVLLAFIAGYFISAWRQKHLSRRALLPPGPPGSFLFGNLRDMPTSQEWHKYTELARRYGPIFYLKLLREEIVVLSDRQLAAEILEKNSANYADRPQNQVLLQMVGWDRGVAFSPYGDRHREYRKLLNTRLSSSATKGMRDLQTNTAHTLLRALVDDPAHFREHIQKVIGDSIITIAFGDDVSSDGFDYIERAEEAHEKLSSTGTPGAHAVDYIPFLRHVPSWFPGAGWKRKAQVWRSELDELARIPYELVKSRIAQNTASPSYVSHCIETMGELTPDKEHTIMWTAASLYTGGADTTSTALTTFFLVMTLFPAIQAKAQAELDQLVGSDRLPNYDDRESLPYVNALVMELLRWRPVVPLGVSRRARAAKMMQGYYIPEGMSSRLNVRLGGIGHDEKVYKDPYNFKPERFLGPDAEPEFSTIPFGMGRRICPGMHLADSSLFLYIASILTMFKISNPKDAQGREYVPEARFTSGVIRSDILSEW
ncbi:hypothetical protein EIP86_004598 [Pleurotus ostreatoroseus]|nr:hypothetical protein EIP86_004598 [Pleurotus ostreatoroseus]